MQRPKFIVDTNVGRLSVWLRALGYDTQFVDPIEDEELIQIALDEDRVILTKDTGIMERRLAKTGKLKAMMISESAWREQLRQLIQDLNLDRTLAFTRCLRCNTELTPADPSIAVQNIPKRSSSAFNRFWHCSTCNRYYWEGSHWERMQSVFEELFTR